MQHRCRNFCASGYRVCVALGASLHLHESQRRWGMPEASPVSPRRHITMQ